MIGPLLCNFFTEGSDSMERRILGNSGLEIAPLIFGGNVFGWTVDEPGAFSLLDAFLASGFNCVDTADSYSAWVPGNRGGESETIIGKWMKLRGNRAKVVIATKVGSEMGPGRNGLSKSYILRAAEDSLRRLQTEYIDLYQTHRDDPGTSVEETLEAYALLVKEGKVRMIGASNLTPERLSASLETSDAKGYPRYQTMQPHYNLCERAAYEKDLEPLCRAQKLSVIPYYPLAAGFLTGKYRSEHDLSKSTRGAGVRKYFNQHGFHIIEALDAVAGRLRATPAAVALAWLLARPGITAPIVSATSLRQWEELRAAPEILLDSSSRELLNRASA
jgi:aryl-alcohol dehydrogenase-like predicted oxidoreductase